ncbi:hypothetical protein VSS37_03515 [Candidatus Thiothrix sp. Deng01]|uniref:Uncharacterized protein n=1 Tax=Candidatus Thiothrix phosphatis TaxID=3112415 RepID=A0ABU6CTF7_9GAMM|nr:hypothetical protein [Candidatus Thiothrix sp. Deng01]MEB4590039.1 hypothetical protein [Candidatus Thiothrix sp. Deng01]
MSNEVQTTENLKPVYYWLDGYWIYDKEEADLMDEINAFGSLHGTALFPQDMPPEQVNKEIAALLTEQGA